MEWCQTGEAYSRTGRITATIHLWWPLSPLKVLILFFSLGNSFLAWERIFFDCKNCTHALVRPKLLCNVMNVLRISGDLDCLVLYRVPYWTTLVGFYRPDHLKNSVYLPKIMHPPLPCQPLSSVLDSMAPCGLWRIVEYGHLVSWPSFVRSDLTRLILFCCVLRCLPFLFCLVFVLTVFLICLPSCIFQHEPTWMALHSLVVLMCR